jgi:two-component system alkaline phosphatase synthesis response regulator PhoP
MSSPSSVSKVLLVDDEQDILDLLRYNLEKEGFQVFTALNGNEGLEAAIEEQPDLIILDIMMPGMDGVELCAKIRETSPIQESLIAFLTARGEDFSQIAGLDAGADDYLTKPVKPKVFVSKVKSLLKRARKQAVNENLLGSNDLMVDLEKHAVTKEGVEIHFPKKEFDLLVLLMSKPGKVFKRAEIYDRIWGSDLYVGDRTIDVHVRKLREKIGNASIRTVKGVGYKYAG